MNRTARLLPPRPPVPGECTCMWRSLYDQRERDHEEAESPSVTQSIVHGSMNPIHALFGGRKEEETDRLVPESTPEIPMIPQAPVNDTQRLVDVRFGRLVDRRHGASDVETRMAHKVDHLAYNGYSQEKKPFRLFGKPIDVKIAELVSYREDLVHLSDSIIPSQKLHDPHSTHPPVMIPVPHTPLCPTCQQNLAYSIYYGPLRRNKFLRETATAGYLALVDDAIASIETGEPLEWVTHNQLDGILRRELAVVEWRTSVILAKYHKQTGYLSEFPVRIGEYAEFSVAVKPPGPPDGLVKKAGKKVLAAVGVTSGTGASGNTQGPVDS